MTASALPFDIERCSAIRLDVRDAQPMPLCQTCRRWTDRLTGGPRTPHMEAPCFVRQDGTVVCDQRIPADAAQV